MPDYNDLERKVEDAFAVIISAYAGLNAGSIFKGQSEGELSMPCTEIHAVQGNEVQAGTGIYDVSVSVTHKSQADQTSRDAHNLRAVKIRDAVRQDTLVDLLNAAGVSELTVLDVFTPQPSQGKDEDARHLVSVDVLRVIAAGASI